MSNIEDCAKFIEDAVDVYKHNSPSKSISLSDAYIILSHFNLISDMNVEKQKLILLSPRVMIIYGANIMSLFTSYITNKDIDKYDKQEVALFHIQHNMCVRHVWDIIYENCYDNTNHECNLAITIEYLIGVYHQKIHITDFSILEHYVNKYKICKILLAILHSNNKSSFYSKEEATNILFTNRYNTFKYGNCSYVSDLDCRCAYKKLVTENDNTLELWKV